MRYQQSYIRKVSGIIKSLTRQNKLQPILDIIQLCTGYRIDMQGWFCEILEDKDEIKLFQSELDALQRCNFDFAQSGHEEWRVGEMDKALCCRLQANICAMGHALE
jgi:hypothetical protein